MLWEKRVTIVKYPWYYAIKPLKFEVAIYRVLGMTLNYIWRWGSTSDDLESLEYFFINISPRSILTHSVTYSYADACRNIFNTIKTGGYSSLEKYTSHFIRKLVTNGLLCERWVEDWTELQHIDPPTTLLATTAFLSRSPGLLNRGPVGPASARTWFSFQYLSPTDLNFLLPGLYNNLMSTYFLRASQFALNSTLRQSRLSPDIFDRIHLLFTQVHFFFW